MHVQVSRVTRSGKTYEYARLVESFRKPNGVPTLRVVANLGPLAPVALENLRTTLRASRAGKRVFAERTVAGARPLKPAENLRFLDVAVLLRLAEQFGLTALLAEVLERGHQHVAPSDVVLALALQRCVDPGSKLYAERWFPRSALPELLRIVPTAFENTRLHRVLDALDDATESLMKKLPLLYMKQDVATSAMFLDCTDARFVGRGPELAEVSKTKEGLFERKIGILLLCNQDGLPLRWKVLSGKTAEPTAMHSTLEAIRGLGWVGQAPVVIDRIMGASAEVQKLVSLGIRFLTAARRNEFTAYAPTIPHATLAGLDCVGHASDETLAACALDAAKCMQAAGLQEVEPTLWVKDLGVVERDAAATPPDGDALGHGIRALKLARTIDERVKRGAAESFRSAGRQLGLNEDLTKSYRKLLRLDEDIQSELVGGKGAGISIAQLHKIAHLAGAEAQRNALESAVIAQPPAPRVARVVKPEAEPGPRLRVRAVLCFNPERFAHERKSTQALLDGVQAAVRALNAELVKPNSRRTHKQIERAVDRLLERKKARELYDVHIATVEPGGAPALYQVRVELRASVWQKRRRHHGFAILLAHPELGESAADIARLYRDKDRVEKDFQTIKSLIKLRPVWHRTDAKVRAHVSICILALLLERLLARALGVTATTADALETLATCHLNRFDGHRSSQYLVTDPSREQRALLRTLNLTCLVDDDDLAAQIQPRPVSL